MWVTVTYACGHEGDVQIYGSGSDRERKARKYGYYLCPDCKYQEARQRVADAREKAQAAGIPELTGSIKQVAWADNIRTQIMSQYDVSKKQIPDNLQPALDYLMDRIVKTHGSASWWIDRRAYVDNAGAFLKAYMRDYPDAKEAARKMAE